jgi:hypothetical protein
MAPGSHGRRRTHERTTNDSDVIIGSALDIDATHSTEVRHTNKKGMTNRCRRDYQDRIKKICYFLEKNYPEYYAVGVRVLSQEELDNLDDLDSFHWKNTINLVYTDMNVKVIQAFFAHAKRKGGNNDKIVSHEQLRKFHVQQPQGSFSQHQPGFRNLVLPFKQGQFKNCGNLFQAKNL